MTFFFHLLSRAEPILDMEGSEFADVEAAARHALTCARELIADDARHGCIDLAQSISVVDEAGCEFHSLNFLDAVVIEYPSAA